MLELEDLRNRSLVWQIDVLHKGRCAIFDGVQEIGHLQQESWWSGTYTADLAGVRWRLQYVSRFAKSVLRLDFADGKRGLAEAFRSSLGYGAMVDGVAK